MKASLKKSKTDDIDVSTWLYGRRLPSPVMSASGTSGHGAELAGYFDLSAIGAVVVKSLSHFAHEGNPAPRVGVLPTGMINSVGLPGPGVRRWIDEYLPDLTRTGANVVVSVWGRTKADYVKAVEQLAPVSSQLMAVEINVSCPNTEKGGEMFGHDSKETAAIVKAVSQTCDLPIGVKLSPNTDRYVEVAGAALDAGAVALIASNTYLGQAHKRDSNQPVLGTSSGGGVSGQGILPLSLRIVRELNKAFPGCDIVGVGGVHSARDALAYLFEGASAVQVGTATFVDPRILYRISEDVKWLVKKQGAQSLKELLAKKSMPPSF